MVNKTNRFINDSDLITIDIDIRFMCQINFISWEMGNFGRWRQ